MKKVFEDFVVYNGIAILRLPSPKKKRKVKQIVGGSRKLFSLKRLDGNFLITAQDTMKKILAYVDDEAYYPAMDAISKANLHLFNGSLTSAEKYLRSITIVSKGKIIAKNRPQFFFILNLAEMLGFKYYVQTNSNTIIIIPKPAGSIVIEDTDSEFSLAFNDYAKLKKPQSDAKGLITEEFKRVKASSCEFANQLVLTSKMKDLNSISPDYVRFEDGECTKTVAVLRRVLETDENVRKIFEWIAK